ncbi:hypothetical protein MJL33_34845, partial [Salmonella enterica subsp. enterica serovar Kentucky]|nr:hypothetical protein [Salmonella enterica subsp. enterica serovar Kentucky]
MRQQIKQDADNRQRQRALMAEMKQASQQVEDWGYLNALIGSKKTVVLVRQFRVATWVNGNQDGMLIETCAGLLDNDEPEVCIR